MILNLLHCWLGGIDLRPLIVFLLKVSGSIISYANLSGLILLLQKKKFITLLVSLKKIYSLRSFLTFFLE